MNASKTSVDFNARIIITSQRKKFWFLRLFVAIFTHCQTSNIFQTRNRNIQTKSLLPVSRFESLFLDLSVVKQNTPEPVFSFRSCALHIFDHCEKHSRSLLQSCFGKNKSLNLHKERKNDGGLSKALVALFRWAMKRKSLLWFARRASREFGGGFVPTKRIFFLFERESFDFDLLFLE